MLLVWSFWLALFLALSAANLSTLVSDDISKAHTVAQHLKWVHKLQFLRSVESAWTFSHDINVHEAYQEFSPSCHLAEEVEFSLQLAICLFCLMLKVLNRFRNSWFFQDFCNTVRHIPECNLDVISPPQKVCTTRFECVSSSLSNCLDFLISTAIFLELECKCTGVVKWQIEVPKKNN